MEKEINKLNKQLEKGILPAGLNFAPQLEPLVIDLEKLKYNSFYRSYEYAESKFPEGHQSIPGFEKVIELCQKNIKSPLEEIEERSNNKKEYDLRIGYDSEVDEK